MDAVSLPQPAETPARGGIAAPPAEESASLFFQQRQLSGTKETTGHFFFRSVVVRWTWRFYSQRLTRAGRWLALPSLAFLGYSLSSLELQAYRPMAFMAGLWFVALCATLLFRPKVKLTARHAERACAGEVIPVDVAVEQRGWLGGIDLRVLPHRLPQEMDAAPYTGADLAPLKRGESATVQIGLYCAKRGAYQLKGFKAETDYPFGIFRAYTFFPDERAVLVYPRFDRLARLDLSSGRRYQPGGVALASVLGDSTEFIGDREFREGDNVRDIDWRASARLDKLIVREYREEYFVRVALACTILPQHGSTRSTR